MRVLLLTAPMTQLNTPYPATAFLTGFLKSRGHEVRQADLSLELALKLFSNDGLRQLGEQVRRMRGSEPPDPEIREFLSQLDVYCRCVDPVIRFLQGRDTTLAYRIVTSDFLPLGRRLRALDPDSLRYSLGTQAVQDLAKHLGSLFLDQIADVVRLAVDPRFKLVRYAEELGESTPSFDALQGALDDAAAGRGTLVDAWLDEIVDRAVADSPEVVGISAPFSGNVYGAFRIAQRIKARHPAIRTVLGGGYVNTELRELTESRVFDYFDFVTLDDGEAPLAALLEHLQGRRDREALIRTYLRQPDGRVTLVQGDIRKDLLENDRPAPTMVGLPLDRYVSFLEVLNPAHRLWSDGRWNKLRVAHGCYWRKCAFCDTSLDYISRYDALSAVRIVDQMEELIRETGQTGFHFVDEAAPPAVLKGVAEELLRRGLTVSWWGNVRFDKAFTPALATLLARSGCIALTGGLEAASDRLLKLMSKGVSVGQVARVTRALSDAGILVHAYLIYGFPSETVQETVDSLERVRQLFSEGCLVSAFWHRFSVTTHSPIGRNPEKFGIRILPEATGHRGHFSRNDLDYEDPHGCTPEELDQLGPGLEKAVYNYMHGMGFDLDLRKWFEIKVPRPKVPKDEIRRTLQ